MSRFRASKPALIMELGVSRWLQWLLLGLMGLAVLSLWLSRVEIGFWLVWMLLAFFAWRGIHRNLPLRLILYRDGRAGVLRQDDSVQPIMLLALHERAGLGVLRIRSNEQVRVLVWAGDTLSRAQRRELRLWMRDHVWATQVASSSTKTTSE